MSYATNRDLERVSAALGQAMDLAKSHAARGFEVEYKDGGSPVTIADREIDQLLSQILPEPSDGWLSEESLDSDERLSCSRVWVVDPIDGTRSFAAGRSDYSVSIALLVDGQPVLGAVGAPSHDVQIVGGPELGVHVTGTPVWDWSADSDRPRLLALRSEVKRGDWDHLEDVAEVKPVGSIAYMLALVAAGCAEATWTKYPKHEWDVAAGAALGFAAGGECWLPRGGHMRWNRNRPRMLSFAAAGKGQRDRVSGFL